MPELNRTNFESNVEFVIQGAFARAGLDDRKLCAVSDLVVAAMQFAFREHDLYDGEDNVEAGHATGSDYYGNDTSIDILKELTY